MNASLFLVLLPLLMLPADALAWHGRPGTYPAYAYAPAGAYPAPSLPAVARPPAYPAYPHYPAYLPPRRAATRAPQYPATPAPAPAARHGLSAASHSPPVTTSADPSRDSHKQRFFDRLLPLVTRENERLLGVRRELTQLQAAHARGGRLNKTQLTWLRELADDYRVEGGSDTGTRIEALLHRVDVIPAGLALAQAANESAWGESRFAREGNNLFGIWTYDADKGIKPQRRAAGKTHLVRRYDSLETSVRDYMHNLNSHPAYQPLRERRAAQRAGQQPLSASYLAEGLTAYSEKGDEYVELIQSMIRSNGLEHVAPLQVADAGRQD